MQRSETKILRRSSLKKNSNISKIKTRMTTLSQRVEIKGEEQIIVKEMPKRLVLMTARETLACLLMKKVRMVLKILHTSNMAEVVVAIGPKQLQ